MDNEFMKNMELNNYLVIAKGEFVRDSQVAPKKWIETNGEHDYENWIDVEGPVILGEVKAKHGELAIKEISEKTGIDKRALIAYNPLGSRM